MRHGGNCSPNLYVKRGLDLPIFRPSRPNMKFKFPSQRDCTEPPISVTNDKSYNIKVYGFSFIVINY